MRNLPRLRHLRWTADGRIAQACDVYVGASNHRVRQWFPEQKVTWTKPWQATKAQMSWMSNKTLGWQTDYELEVARALVDRWCVMFPSHRVTSDPYLFEERPLTLEQWLPKHRRVRQPKVPVHRGPPLAFDARTVYIDESGVGALAGDMFVVGFMVPATVPADALHGVRDSKALKAEDRAGMVERMRALPVITLTEQVSVEEIDARGIWKAWDNAVAAILTKARDEHGATQALIDGKRSVPCPAVPLTTVIKGDAKVAGIAAASIWAKYHRDRYMHEQATRYKDFAPEFALRHGYFSNEHKVKLLRGLVTPLHRRSYNPLKRLLA